MFAEVAEKTPATAEDAERLGTAWLAEHAETSSRHPWFCGFCGCTLRLLRLRSALSAVALCVLCEPSDLHADSAVSAVAHQGVVHVVVDCSSFGVVAIGRGGAGLPLVSPTGLNSSVRCISVRQLTEVVVVI